MRKILAVFCALFVYANEPLIIAEQGSFSIGGSYVQNEGEFSYENFLSPKGQRAYGDFAYVAKISGVPSLIRRINL